MSNFELAAQNLGAATAWAEIENGAQYPIDSPLSGEWAGDLTPRELVFRVYGEHISESLLADVTDELCDSFETGYRAKWAEWEDELSSPAEPPC